MAPTSYACRYCKKSSVARSLQGLRSHISQSPECRACRDEERTLLSRNRSTRDGVPHAHQQPTRCSRQEESLDDDTMPPPDDHIDDHRSKRAWVDDCDDDNNDNDNDNFRFTHVNFIIDYPEDACAGAILEDTNDGLETRFDKIKCAQQATGTPAWAPFNSLADWELSRWLVQSGVSQREIDKFLKLELVRWVFAVMTCDEIESPLRFSLAPIHPPKINTHSSRRSISSPGAQSGYAKYLRSLETARMRTVKPLLRLSSGGGTQLSVCAS